MSLTPPSSHGSGGLNGVTLTGTPTAGQVITATDATDATWQTPAGGSTGARVRIDFATIPVLGHLAQITLADFAQAFEETITAPPLIFGASDSVSFDMKLFDIPDLSDTLDITYLLYVTNQLGTSTGTITGGVSTSTPTSEYDIDFTGTSATIVGVDLSWDDTVPSFTSAAGGVYTVFAALATGPD